MSEYDNFGGEQGGEGINFVSTQAAGMLLCVNTWTHGGREKSLSGREASDP